MKELDYDWLKRIHDAHDRWERSVPLESKTTRCTKGILIDRYFKFLDNRAFKLLIPINTDGKYVTEDKVEYEIVYAWFQRSRHTVTTTDERDGEAYYSHGVQKYNGWNDSEFTISFRDEKLKRRSIKLHWNGILRIKYEEIPLNKYWEVAELFLPPISNEKPYADYHFCKHMDEAQGKYLCTSKDIESRKCVGVDCGFYKETRE